MIPDEIIKRIYKDDKIAGKLLSQKISPSIFKSSLYHKSVAIEKYFLHLSILRHYIKRISDYYFSEIINAKNIDLFMMTNSISSPVASGSDSEPIDIQFGKLKTFLTDSAQFGFEPLIINHFDKVYCYLPSMRGEKPDETHLNQFFHCELEIRGTLEKLIPIAEGYVKILSETLLLLGKTVKKMSNKFDKTKYILKKIIKASNFPSITFDNAIDILIKNGYKKLIKFNKNGRDISHMGEIKLTECLKTELPIWIKFYDRDRIAFYQKPKSDNPEKTINADLIFPPLVKEAVGGEIIGSGQRQDNTEELLESLKRQKINPSPYRWYISLRNIPSYKKTSGFGLGIERFIAWALAYKNIKDVILYPRLKNIIMTP